MKQIFIELYNYKSAWIELAELERSAFTEQVVEAVNGLERAGVEVLGFGYNSKNTDRRASYDFFCVYRTPSEVFNHEFERQVTESGWYNYFDQVNISGSIQTPAELFSANARLEGSDL